MVRNSTKKAATTPLTAAAANTSSPATSPSATPLPARGVLSPTSPPSHASNTASAAAVSQSSEKLNSKNVSTDNSNSNAKRLKETPITTTSQTPSVFNEKIPVASNEATSQDAGSSKESSGLRGIIANEAASDEPKIKQFDCKGCGRRVKMDAGIPESAHICAPNFVVARPRRRLRGPPPYQYLSEEGLTISRAATRRGAKKSGGAADDKRKPDPEREAWLRSEVMNKVYDKDALWCRYCGCEQASGWSRGPWGPKKLCTIHYVQWFKKKALDLSKYPEEPTEPINRMENTEYDYMKRMQLKSKKEDESE